MLFNFKELLFKCPEKLQWKWIWIHMHIINIQMAKKVSLLSYEATHLISLSLKQLLLIFFHNTIKHIILFSFKKKTNRIMNKSILISRCFFLRKTWSLQPVIWFPGKIYLSSGITLGPKLELTLQNISTLTGNQTIQNFQVL